MDESRRLAIKAELDEAIRKHAQLAVVIAYLAEQIGEEVDLAAAPGVLTTAKTRSQASPASPMAAVSEGEFFSASAPKAALALLERMGQSRPLKTQEIYQAIEKGGVKIKNTDILYNSLHRDARFIKVGKSLWSLSKWHGGRSSRGEKGGDPDLNGHGESEDPGNEHGGATEAEERNEKRG